MKYFVHSLGSFFLFLALTFTVNKVHATDPEYIPSLQTSTDWTKLGTIAVGTLLGSIAIAQLEHSEVIFAGLYSAGALYYSSEYIHPTEPMLEDYIVPISLVTLGLTNLTLLRNDDRSKSTIAAVNFIGLSLIGTYWYNFERIHFRIGLTPNSVHLAFEF